MKPLTLFILITFANLSFAGNYIIDIDGTSYEISLDEEKKIKLGDTYSTIALKQKSYLDYVSENFSFKYPNKYSPSTSSLGSGISQTAMITPLGTTLIIQEYATLNPSSLLDLMVSELTKEEREYGYKIESKPTYTTLSDGTILKGKVITSKYKDSDIERFLYTYGKKDSGLLIMTQIDYAIAEDNEKNVIQKFLKSLIITL